MKLAPSGSVEYSRRQSNPSTLLPYIFFIYVDSPHFIYIYIYIYHVSFCSCLRATLWLWGTLLKNTWVDICTIMAIEKARIYEAYHRILKIYYISYSVRHREINLNFWKRSVIQLDTWKHIDLSSRLIKKRQRERNIFKKWTFFWCLDYGETFSHFII